MCGCSMIRVRSPRIASSREIDAIAAIRTQKTLRSNANG